MKIYGIFGYPLEHTLSPAMQEAAFEKAGRDAVYLPFELDPLHFRGVARYLARTPLSGFNLTIPYKEAVIPYLDWVDKDARAIGAVNTVKRVGSRFLGYNTDWEGFVRGLEEEGFRISGKKAAVLGAGGAARACVYGLMKRGVRGVKILNRHPERGRRIQRGFKRLFPGPSVEVFPLRSSFLRPILEEVNLLVNATPVGLGRERHAWSDASAFPRREVFICDLIYNPAETLLLKQARKRGCRTLNGLSMLLFQGAKAFEIWTGRRAPVAVMRQALVKALAREGWKGE